MIGCSAGPLEPAPAFDAGPAPTRELPHSWVDPVFVGDSDGDGDAARPDGEPPSATDAGDPAPDASHEGYAPCARGCVRDAGQMFALRAGRLAFIEDGKLFLQALPDGEPEQLDDLSERAVPALDLDDQRVVYADDEHREIVVIAIATRERRVLPYGNEDGGVSGGISIDSPYVSYSLDLPPSSSHAWADEWEVFVTDLDREETRVVGPHRLTIQYGPVVRGETVLWEDDRNGHHDWDLRFFHQYELMSARLDRGDELASLYKRDDESVTLYAFDGARALIASTWDAYIPSYVLVDVRDGTLTELSDRIEPGDVPMDVLGDLILVARKPALPGQCYLQLLDLAGGREVEVSEPGQCPNHAQTDGRFAAWSQLDLPSGTTRAYFRDLGGLVPER